MTYTTRTAIPASKWAYHDLETYNITLTNQSSHDFYGQDLPETLEGIDPELVDANLPVDATNDITHRLLMYLDLAWKANPVEDSALSDFTKELLRTLGFDERNFYFRSHYAIPLHICYDPTQTVPTDVCLLHRTAIIVLIIQEARKDLFGKDPDAQVVAAAIAAYQRNNQTRRQLGMGEQSSMSFPCISMIGTRPIFYVVTVTEQLSKAVQLGKYPEEVTEVRRCVTVNRKQYCAGMERPEFRKEVLKHFVLFRLLARSLWSKLVQREPYPHWRL